MSTSVMFDKATNQPTEQKIGIYTTRTTLKCCVLFWFCPADCFMLTYCFFSLLFFYTKNHLKLALHHCIVKILKKCFYSAQIVDGFD